MNNIKRYSRYKCEGATIAERFDRTIANLLKKSVFQRRNANWTDELIPITERYNNTVHHSTKFTIIQASLKKNEKTVYHKLQD